MACEYSLKQIKIIFAVSLGALNLKCKELLPWKCAHLSLSGSYIKCSETNATSLKGGQARAHTSCMFTH